MYHEFYQFKENPFNVTADPDFFYRSAQHTDALSNLLYGIHQRKGIVVITGEVGVGKTTLCRKLLKEFDTNTRFAFILNPSFSDIELLQMIVHDLGINFAEQNKLSLIYALNQFLLTQSKKGHNVVLIIDEAQNLAVNQLEQIRLLSNLETEKEKLLQILLVGHPELNETLKLPELRQLRQRIAVHFHIRPLEKNDIKNYITHRMHVAMQEISSSQKIIFTDRAVDAIYQYTQGSPRSINILCDRALLAGFVSETYHIDESIIEHCAGEVLCCEHHL